MGYISPIDLIISEMNMRMDGEIFKAVQNVGVNVDRDELLKALQYDRDQYQKGYKDRDDQIVRCKDCKSIGYTSSHWFCKWLNRCVEEDWFCADGKRKEGR